MRLAKALALIQQKTETIRRRTIFLVCGFQPLHLATFFQAHFASRFADDAVDVQTGLYGDLEGTFDLAAESKSEAAATIIEWSDLDSRLGLRSSGGWGPSVQDDIVATCREGWSRIFTKLESLASKMPIALALPTLPRPFFGHTTSWQMSLAEAELERQVAEFSIRSARLDSVRIAHPARLGQLGLPLSRLDAKMALAAGFPYSIGHASALALQLTHLLFPDSPLKGIITDLDETLWRGILGDVGASAVTWSLADHSQIHGLYQQELQKLAEMGVLLAIASKNEATAVEDALRRSDLYVRGNTFFPVYANWKPKSNSVAAILETWNIGPESVVFVDDSPMELEEVRTAFPTMKCLLFPTSQLSQALHFLMHLRDLFGKPVLQREDALRQASIRANALIREFVNDTSGSEFVKELQGKVTFDFRKDASNKRLLELINKTNQCNLNGVRISEGEWMRHLADPASFVMSVSYEDKFGPLGVIAVVAGRRSLRRLEISAWVMSCRAFSRQVEFHTLEHLFQAAEIDDILLCYQPTERNAPMQQFLRLIGAMANEKEKWVLSRDVFSQSEHELPHDVAVIEKLPRQG